MGIIKAENTAVTVKNKYCMSFIPLIEQQNNRAFIDENVMFAIEFIGNNGIGLASQPGAA